MSYTNGLDDPSAYFQTAIYSGSNSELAVTNDGNSDLKPDWLWIKQRSSTEDHMLVDSTRGVTKYLQSNSTGAEATVTSRVKTLDTDGFTLNGASNPVNAAGATYVGWQWKAGGGTTASNTSGSITSTVQANTTAGFSIVTFTGNGTDGATVGHGLGVVPAMVIFKCRDTTNTDWRVYHQSISPTNAVSINSTGAQYSASSVFTSAFTSTLLNLENDTGVNRNTSPMIAYCFADVQGFSKFGSFIANGVANGPFVHLGFKPAFLILRNITNAGYNWWILDNKRNTFNLTDEILYTNLNAAEFDGSGHASNMGVDFLSNGFKVRTTNTGINNNGGTTIYMAWAENPFVTSTDTNSIPTTAR